MRLIIDRSGYSALQVFEALSAGRGGVTRADLEAFIQRYEYLEPEPLVWAWQQMGKAPDTSLTSGEFMAYFDTVASGALSAPSAPLAAPLAAIAGTGDVDWVQHTDPQTQRPFYYSNSQRRSSWTDHRSQNLGLAPSAAAPLPVGPESAVAAVPAEAADWVEYQDPVTQKKFFHSSSLRRSSWTAPPGFGAGGPLGSIPPQQQLQPPAGAPSMELLAPAAGTTPAAPAEASSDWVEFTDPQSQRMYYWSTSQRRASWTDHRLPRQIAATPGLESLQPLAAPAEQTYAAAPAPAPLAASPLGDLAPLAPLAPVQPLLAPAQPLPPLTAPLQPLQVAPAAAPLAPLAPPPGQPMVSDWVEHEDPQTLRRFYHSASQRRTTWTDYRFVQQTGPQPPG